MSCSWTDASRLGGALAASVALHLSVGGAIDALPWGGPGGAPSPPEPGAARLQVEIRVAQAAANPARQAAAEKPAKAAPSGRYYLARELDVRPAPRQRVDPAYPNDAFLRDISGRVVARLYITESGAVERALILHAEPPGYFEEAVEQAFRAARFTPAMKNGRPVKAQMVIEVRYDSPRRLAPQ